MSEQLGLDQPLGTREGLSRLAWSLGTPEGLPILARPLCVCLMYLRFSCVSPLGDQ